MKCRHCAAPLTHTFLDLGFAPPSNAYLAAADLSRPEKYYPLRIMVCDGCWLVQTEDYAGADELFSADYAYFSSTSSGWLQHAAEYATRMTRRLDLGSGSFVIEVASNDGYLLKNFVAAGIPCLGIEPTASTAAAAESLGVPVLREFFGEAVGSRLAAQGRRADLIAGNNVYAHVPDINDFTRGLAAVLKPQGTITLEFPHVMRLIEQCQFDTVYHEHFSYLSLAAVQRIFAAAGLRVWDVEELPTHGGSLRVYGCHASDPRATAAAVERLLAEEDRHGLRTLAPYAAFQARADRVKDDLLAFLIEQKRAGRKVAAYGAAAKGNTLLNYAGVKPDLLPYVCDAAAAKQGKFMPGSHVPILPPSALLEGRPDDVLILPWNIAAEVRQTLHAAGLRGVRYVTAVPDIRVHQDAAA
ncbi:class I SAM-dependent methyltransferase [Ramlibacter montanisoli]|uniref:Methyltransferase domain-containing protein n=1 Tax=Ramlibacter montanisoli TaxID=2732512 RepID=A0A849K824_9BURK|nr:class I SAM-dependent methyltransferase [Ramlibacter montanisoli]NNU43660.1 methyltransferase domain-containing protein [Ramlibacter montanisoli]